jgi:hypothetical protein
MSYITRVSEAKAKEEASKPAVPQAAPQDEDSVGGIFSRFMESASDKGGRFFEGVMDPIYGASQFLENSVEEVAPGVVDAVNDADVWLHDKTGGWLGKAEDIDVDEQLRRREQAYEDKYDVEGVDWMRGAGNVATGIALAPAAIGSGGLGTTALALAAEGAAGGAFMPQVGEGDYWDQVQSDALLGAIGGGVGGTALHAGGRALTNQLNRAGMGVLKEAGVQPTVGQAVGGVVDSLEQKATSIPLIGDAVRHARRRAAGELREAAFKEAGDVVGEVVEETGEEGIQALQRLSKGAYDDLTKYLPELNVTDDFAGSFKRIISDADNNGFDTPSLTAGKRFVDQYITPKLNKGSLSPSEIKDIDVLLKKRIKNAGSDNAKKIFENMREKLIGEAASQSDGFATQLAKADELYAKKSVLEKATQNGDDFTPKQLDNAVKANDKAYGGGRNATNYVAGRGPLRELSKAGREVLGDTVPDSGTAGRVFLGGAALTGGGAATGMVGPFLGAALAAGAGSTRIGQKGTIGLLDMLAKGGAAVGREGRAAGSLLSYLGDD